jgi:hypothetical protein
MHHEKYLEEHTKHEAHSIFKDKILNPPLAVFKRCFTAWSAVEQAGFKYDLQFCRQAYFTPTFK